MDEIIFKIKKRKRSKKNGIFIGIALLASLAILVPLLANWISSKYAVPLRDQEKWLDIHLIPHSHDDVGWLETPENYYNDYVRFILDNAIFELKKNKYRKFVYAETYFFSKWWKEKTKEMQKLVRKLIIRKQLEIIGGGFCMSDEAVTHYQSFIDQSTWGFRFLNDTFGSKICPKVAWQIDTFGHSKGIASLFAQMGFDSLFFARLDPLDRAHRKDEKSMEFLWCGNENLGESGSIFTSVFHEHYSAPKGFDFEMEQQDAKINFDDFSKYVRNQSRFFVTNNILVPMGDDFRYVNAKKYFDKMDELIGFFKNNPQFRLNVFYATPSTYIRKLKKENLTWPQKRGDFFPYSADPRGYWTGYFTSRPTLKYFERIANNFLQITKQLLVLAYKGMEYFDELTNLREAVAVLQHHDAITGTSQQHVTDHYAKLLHDGIEKCGNPVDVSLGNLSVMEDNVGRRPIYRSCLLLNISSCSATENISKFIVTIYNPSSRKVDYYARIPVTGKNYAVLTADGTEITSQMVSIPKSVREIPGRKSAAKSELVFKAANLPAMGFKSYYVTERFERETVGKTVRVSGAGNLKAIFNGRSRLLAGFKLANRSISLGHVIKYYEPVRNSSGAYLFGPSGESRRFPRKPITKLISSGEIVKEYEQKFSDWASQIIRIYRDEEFAEFEWLIGPIPIRNSTGKEVISVYSSKIESGDVYYTDVNGLEMEKRIRNYRDWSGKVAETISGNYYPITSMISIGDDENQMNLIVDRSQGGASLRSGEIELMIHRRLCYDDGRGVTEPLDEFAYGTGLVARGRHWLLFGKREPETDRRAKIFAQTRHSEPWPFFLDATSLNFEEWRSNYLTEFSGLLKALPRNVRFLTLEPWRKDKILLRFENIFQKDLNSSGSSNESVEIHLKDLFCGFEIVKARETALGADRWISDVKRIEWISTNFERNSSPEDESLDPLSKFTVRLEPQQIRTFIVKIRPKFDLKRVFLNRK